MALRVLGTLLIASAPGAAWAQTAAEPQAAASVSAAVAAAPWIAGLQPDVRPAAAPRLTSDAPDAALLRARLHGVSGQPPRTVLAVAQQSGRWWMPMFHPGLTGRYDLRGWHAGARPAYPGE